MIIVKYCGGLGNQMYQYAMQAVLEKRFPEQQFKADLSHYSLFDEHNGFELDRYFGLRFVYASRKEVRHVYAGLVPGKWWKFCPRAFRDFVVHKLQWRYLRLMERLRPSLAERTVTESELPEKMAEMGTGDWYLRGMWQRVELFEQYRKEIIEAFDLKPELTAQEQSIVSDLREGKAIAVHVRGGDFLKGTTFNLCGEEYYSRALQLFSQQLPLYVFTDDKGYASTLLKDHPVKAYVSHRIDESIKDMYMMSCARYQLITNSTFSFWSAFLNRQAELVVCPKYATKTQNGYVEATGKSDWIVVENAVCSG